MAQKDLKVGVHEGGGPPPGYSWSVLILDEAYDEATSFLGAGQYRHASDQFKALAREDDPGHSVTQDVDAIEDFHELRDKGGVLGNINLRVFFYLDKERSTIVVLGASNKKNDGPTPQRIKIRIRNRLRRYRRGGFTGP